MKKGTKIGIACGSVGGFLVIGLIVWIICGYTVEWGPFAYLAFNKRANEIVKTYDSSTRKKEIVFYGASNFRLWKEMDEDMQPYVVQNHGFGGSTDADLMSRANKLLYPYDPSIVVFQTGSNDLAKIGGKESTKYDRVVARKAEMFDKFHEKLPNATFAVCAGILMPGRSQYDDTIKKVNDYLEEYCATRDYMYFVDSEDMTVDENGNHYTDMFIEDGIHLTHESRLKWADNYIKPVLAEIASAHPEYTNIIK